MVSTVTDTSPSLYTTCCHPVKDTPSVTPSKYTLFIHPDNNRNGANLVAANFMIFNTPAILLSLSILHILPGAPAC